MTVGLAHVRRLPGALMPVPPGLLRGWRGTVFAAAAAAAAGAAADAGAEARLGRRSPGMDALLARSGVRGATILGAWNPFSRKAAQRRNDAMHRSLLLRLRRARPPAIEAVGRPWRGTWPPEAHVMLPGDGRPALRLARLFRQHAVLALRLRAPCRLLVLR